MKKTITKILALTTLSGIMTACTPTQIVVTNFEECEKIGSTIMESYPRQCRYGDQSFSEDIGNELEKSDKIKITNPRPNQAIKSPLTITGEARGPWFFEATFPVELKDENGKTLAQTNAQATEIYTTEDFVPFTATIEFKVDPDLKGKKGILILKNDNPSGLPENDDSLEVPVLFE